ncbi:hypothetical protein NE865_01822 [Phthorimaea operculella]|nr:hypothetical protein NE865_01822 [Phthorimaea operculella]
MSKNLERLYKEGKCNECSVVVTPMDFAKILGKFTKVKIQYESGSPKNKKSSQVTSPTNARLKNNENGMVLIHRNAYNQHPADLLKSPLKSPKTYGRATPRTNNKTTTPQTNNLQTTRENNMLSPPARANNILKENNRLKKTPAVKKPNNILKNDVKSNLKRYGIIFTSPKSKKLDSAVGNMTLKNILPSIDKNILPSDDWSIDYLPKHGEPKEDKVYDRIAAELEDLMNNKTAGEKAESKTESGDNKDDFPSIMDILNDNTMTTTPANNQSSTAIQSNLESSDVEAMLLGKSSDSSQDAMSTPMEVDSSVISNLIDAVEMSIDKDDPKPQDTSDQFDNPNSPSILDETLEKGIEAHLPSDITSLPNLQPAESSEKDPKLMETDTKNNTLEKSNNDAKANEVKNSTVTHVVFKKCVNGECTKSVTCPNNLKYTIELEGKSVELLGAPKYISCLDDLEVLLQIVNETELNSLYVCH